LAFSARARVWYRARVVFWLDRYALLPDIFKRAHNRGIVHALRQFILKDTEVQRGLST
jgi:hypothetical protein